MVLIALVDHKYRVLVLSSPPFASRPATDGSPMFDRVRATAERLGNPWRQQVRVESLQAGTNLIITAHSHDLLGRKIRDRATYGAIGYHPSLLPAAPRARCRALDNPQQRLRRRQLRLLADSHGGWRPHRGAGACVRAAEVYGRITPGRPAGPAGRQPDPPRPQSYLAGHRG